MSFCIYAVVTGARWCQPKALCIILNLVVIT